MANNFFNRLYPIVENKWKLSIYVSLFIAFFLPVFQPFGLQFVEIEYKTLTLAGYGLVTFIILVFLQVILPLIFKKLLQADKWTVWKEILWLTCIFVCISIGNYFYSVLLSIVPWIGIRGFIIFVLFTVPVAIIPTVIIIFISQNIQLRRNLKLSEKLNNNISDKNIKSDNEKIIVLNSGTQEFTFEFNDILFFEAEGNYIQVNYIENKEAKSQIIRNTIKNIEEEIQNINLFKCHRAFIVNIKNIKKVEGNSHGLSISIKGVNKQIPVSRSNTKAFTELLNSTKN